MGELIKLVLNEFWKRLIEPLLRVLDTWDFAFLALVGISVFAWWKLWDTYSSLEEWGLWASLFGLVVVVWFLLRIGTRKRKKGVLLIKPRPPEPSAYEIRKARIRLVLLKIALPLGFAIIWSYAAFTIYRMPTFSEDVFGIYVARFENDRGGLVQNRIVDLIRFTIKKQQLPNTIDVRSLTRTIGENDEDSARSLGKRGRAVMVLWGKVIDGNTLALSSKMVVVNAHGVSAQAVMGGYVGTEIPNFHLPRDLVTLGQSVALFLGGYNHYHSREYGASLKYFRVAQEALEQTSGVTEPGASPEKLMLGAIHFYVANALLLNPSNEQSSNKSEKVAEIQNNYDKAVEFTAHPVEGRPQYIEPLNNLGFFLIATHKPDEAIKKLQQAEQICQQENDRQAGLCSVVTYNLGGARLEKLEYEEALRLFKQTIQKIEKLKQTGQDQQYVLLLPRAHLSTGAAYVRSADKAAPENRETLCQMSQVELEKARELISPTDSERAVLLDKINLTQARVYLARRDWGRALETLKTVSLKNDPDLDLLLSIAYFCNNDEEQADTNLLEFLGYFFGRRDDPKYNDDREYEQRLKMQCASERGVPK